MSHRRPTYSGTRKLSDHSLIPHPRTVFPVHRDRDGDLQEAAAITPFPVEADLVLGQGLGALQQTMDALLTEQQLTNLHLSRLIGEDLVIDDLEEK